MDDGVQVPGRVPIIVTVFVVMIFCVASSQHIFSSIMQHPELLHFLGITINLART